MRYCPNNQLLRRQEHDGSLLKEAVFKLLEYCQQHGWAGHDPYDALNSQLFRSVPLLDHKLPRLFLTQVLKRSPVNLRPLLMIPETQNPKALGLFVTALIKLDRIGMLEDNGLVGELAERLSELRSEGTPLYCWGYSFPWQTRSTIIPRWAPNLVCTTFAANALADAYEHCCQARYLTMAWSACEYILKHLYWSEGRIKAGFSYPTASTRVPVHNANFLAAALLCRVARLTGEKKFLGPALTVARYSASQQRRDGSWEYGELPSQRWIDNFHTGYNLCALQSLGEVTGTAEFEPNVRRGYAFYLEHFFREDGAPRYFHNRTYPIDGHSVAQSIITLLKFKDLDSISDELANRVYNWAMDHLWDEKGFFHYRVGSFYRVKTSYMRWVQAWMFLALCTLLEETQQKTTRVSERNVQLASQAAP